MTRSMGPAEEVSLPLPARIRKDALTTVGERGNAQTQVDGRVSQQGTAGNSSPFARPGSRAGNSIGAASEVGTPSTPNNPFARPDSRAGSTQRSPSSSSISLLSPSNSVSHGDADTSVCWDLVNPDLDSEVANINNNSPHSHIIATNQPCPNVKEGPSNTNPPGPNNQDCTLYNHDFFIADTTGRRLSQVQDKSRYPQLLPNGNAALQLRLPDLLIYLKTDTFLIDVTTGHHYAMYNNRIEKMSVLPKLYSAWPYRQLMKNLQDDATRFGVSSPEPNTSGAQGLQDQQPVSNPQHTQKEQPSSPCQPTVVRYEPPTFSLKMPSEMLTRAERVRVLQNHVAAVNALFNKIAVLEDLINKEPHNSSHYKEVQRVQRNQHMHVAVKLQQMLEADDQLREAAGLPQLDLPEHLWSVRNMAIAQAREEHFMTITSEIEILCQQTKGKGMYPNLKQNIANNNVHFHPIQPAQTSPLQPMDFIAMDLIGEFHPPSSQGNRYALTGICMLTGFTWCIPLKSKKAAEVSRAYLQHVYSVLGGSTKILTDNGTEFKNEVFKEMLQKLGTEKLIHSPPYRPQSNGRIEGFHRYLKACMAKYMRAGLEWDEVTAMATAAYNYFPNMSAKESAFFLMYGRDPLNKLSAILNAPRRYLGDATGFPDLEALKNMYQMVAQQLINSRERYVKSNRYNKVPDHGILVGDLVLVKDHTAKSFQPKYKEDFRVVQVYGTNALQVSDKRGKLHNVHITDVRKINMTEKIAAQLQEAYNNKGRTAKHLIPQGRIPDLGWNTDQQGKERQTLPKTTPEAPATQTMPQQAEGPPSSRLRSTSKITTHMDPPERNPAPVDPTKQITQVNQVQTVPNAGFGWQTVLALTIIVNLLMTLFLYCRL